MAGPPTAATTPDLVGVAERAGIFTTPIAALKAAGPHRFQQEERARDDQRLGVAGHGRAPHQLLARRTRMKTLDIIAAILLIVGGLNWGLVGAFQFNLVTALFGQTILASIVFVLVGIAGIFLVARLSMSQKQLGVVPA